MGDTMTLAAGRSRQGAAALALALALGACSAFDNGSAGLAYTIAQGGERMGMPWGSMRAAMPTDSLTVQRVATGRDDAPRLTTESERLVPDAATLMPNTSIVTSANSGVLMPESGDVWPGPLPPRTTLANPDAALRGVPDYRPADPSNLGGMPPSTRRGTPASSSSLGGLPPSLRGSSSPPPVPALPPEPQSLTTLPPSTLPPPPPAPRTDGQVIMTPNGPVVTSGGTDRVQTFTVPGGAGTAIRDGNTTTLFGPGGQIQVVPNTPR